MKCRGLCKGDRAANEGPARVDKNTKGKRIVWCTCCEEVLTFVPTDFSTGAPNVKEGIEHKEYRFTDTTCEYDVVVLSGLK